MTPIACFLLEPTDRVALALRRYTGPGCHGAGAPRFFDGPSHYAKVPLGEFPIRYGEGGVTLASWHEDFPEGDPRWPEKCSYCEHRFEGHPFQGVVDQEPIYRDPATGREWPLREAPVGAMFYADWYPKGWDGPDGRTLICMVPGIDGKPWEWLVDGRASNCTRPDDWTHRCWVRTGVPPKVTAGKHGNTCSAGAGSILTPGWHGFLRDGVLVTC